MMLTNEGYDARSRKLADGMYLFESGQHIWIEAGVLFLPRAVVDVATLLTSRVWLRGVDDERGAHRLFVRASDVIEVAPHLAETVRAIAAKYQCQV
jgi:hypothetical protein